MGKRARATSRKPRSAVERDANIDLGNLGAVDDAGNTGAAAVGGDPEFAELPSGSTVDPAAITGSGTGDNGSGDSAAASAAPERVKRTYRKRSAKAADPLPLSALAGWSDIILSTHAMLHGLTQNPLFEIDDSDAEKIARLSSNVARHYDNIPGVSPKTKDWIMFIQGAGAIYGPRFAAWRIEKAMARKAAPRQQSPHAPQNVAPAPTAPNQPAASSPSPGIAARTQVPPNVMGNGAAPAARNQPGLATLDGADLPLKMN